MLRISIIYILVNRKQKKKLNVNLLTHNICCRCVYIWCVCVFCKTLTISKSAASPNDDDDHRENRIRIAFEWDEKKEYTRAASIPRTVYMPKRRRRRVNGNCAERRRIIFIATQHPLKSHAARICVCVCEYV